MCEEKFVVDDLSKAEWAMKKIAEKESKISELKEQALKMHADIDIWLKGETEKFESDKIYFQLSLQPYVDEQLKDSKKKSLKLPSGTVGYRKGTQKFKYKGNDITAKSPEFIEFIEKNSPDYIETVKNVKWADFKKTLKIDGDKVISQDGEILDITVQQSEDTFYAKAGK